MSMFIRRTVKHSHITCLSGILIFCLNPLIIEGSDYIKLSTAISNYGEKFAKSANPDEMPQSAASHLDCTVGQRTRIKTVICDLYLCIMHSMNDLRKTAERDSSDCRTFYRLSLFLSLGISHLIVVFTSVH